VHLHASDGGSARTTTTHGGGRSMCNGVGFTHGGGGSIESGGTGSKHDSEEGDGGGLVAGLGSGEDGSASDNVG
jgi:hypothetical protein